ncbi:response regulator [Brevibacillus centrosporus]|uniref:response regulator n=1 Tax=Brevibacillus centrosporus TaxID=54910 RepID=UPI002E1BE37D|nr:response regulator [Brevibacillus centrosporus]
MAVLSLCADRSDTYGESFWERKAAEREAGWEGTGGRKLRVVLIDDERLAIQYMEKILDGIEGIEIVGRYQDSVKALHDIQSLRPDVVFLDVEMPERDGIETAEEISLLLPDTDIVFVTAYEEYAVKAFELDALDYVLKPVQRERLQKTLKRLQKEKEWMAEEKRESSPQAKIHCFQSLQIEVSGGGLQTIRWRTAKAQELFAFLIHRRGKPVRKDYLLELFWTDMEWKKGYSLLYTTVYQIRKTLERLGNGLKITNLEDGYLLEMGGISLDVEEWESQLRSLPPISEDSLSKHMELIEQYRGDYFAEYDYLWAESERQRLRADWYDHAMQVGRYLVGEREYPKAIALYLRLLQFLPHLEELHFTLMQLYDTVGDREAVTLQYNQLRNMLKEDFDMDPRPDVTEWLQKRKHVYRGEIEGN